MNQKYRDAMDLLLQKHSVSNYLDSPGAMNRFGLFSGALYHLMPEVPYSQHFDLYRSYLYHCQWASLDMSFFVEDDPFELQGWSEILRDLREAAPAIVGTFHYGSYRLLPYLLQKHGIPFCLLVRGQVRVEQSSYFSTLLQKQRIRRPLYTILDADDPLAALKVRRMLRDGYHVLSYFDGAEAIQYHRGHDCPSVSIMGARIKVREGLPYLAARFKTSLKVVYGNRVGEVGHTLAMCTWTAAEVADIGAVPLMQILFSGFEKWMQKDPMAWENWGNMYRLLHLEAGGAETAQSERTPENSSLLAFGKSYYVLDKKTLTSYEINEKVYKETSRQWLGVAAVVP